jgi:glycosyltransferase involved in cell wall biosynthesis
MITKNEQNNITNCLKSVRNFVDEIIIIDTGSEDQTKDIALSFGAKVFDFEWTNDFSAARNFALSKSSSDWNLVLDADEQIVKWDKRRINQFLDAPQSIGRIKVVSNFLQNGQEQKSQETISRLLPKGVFFTGMIHEQVDSDLPRMDIPIEIFHTGYFKTDKSKRNLHLLLLELKDNKQNPYILYQLGKQYRSMKQMALASHYFAEAFTYINHEEKYEIDLIVNYLYSLIDEKQFQKALEIITSQKEWLNQSPDFHFVCGIFYMNYVLYDTKNNLSYLPHIENAYLKCLSLNQHGWDEIVIGTSSYLAAYNLAVFYETTGNLPKAKQCYQMAANYSYNPALQRLNLLK